MNKIENKLSEALKLLKSSEREHVYSEYMKCLKNYDNYEGDDSLLVDEQLRNILINATCDEKHWLPFIYEMTMWGSTRDHNHKLLLETEYKHALENPAEFDNYLGSEEAKSAWHKEWMEYENNKKIQELAEKYPEEDVCPDCGEENCGKEDAKKLREKVTSSWNTEPKDFSRCFLPEDEARQKVYDEFMGEISDLDPSSDPLPGDLSDVLIHAVRNPDWCKWLMQQMMWAYNKDEVTKMHTDVERCFSIEAPVEYNRYFFSDPSLPAACLEDPSIMASYETDVCDDCAADLEDAA
jgi:hypothetical protein